MIHFVHTVLIMRAERSSPVLLLQQRSVKQPVCKSINEFRDLLQTHKINLRIIYRFKGSAKKSQIKTHSRIYIKSRKENM